MVVAARRRPSPCRESRWSPGPARCAVTASTGSRVTTIRFRGTRSSKTPKPTRCSNLSSRISTDRRSRRPKTVPRFSLPATHARAQTQENQYRVSENTTAFFLLRHPRAAKMSPCFRTAFPPGAGNVSPAELVPPSRPHRFGWYSGPRSELRPQDVPNGPPRLRHSSLLTPYALALIVSA